MDATQVHSPRSEPERRELPPPSDPMAVARCLVADRFTDGSLPTIRSWRGDFYHFDGRIWLRREDAAVRALAYGYLEHKVYDHKGNLVDWRPSRPKITNLLDALRAVVGISNSAEPPVWINHDGVDPHRLVVMNNGILDLNSRELHPHDSRLFAFVALPFDYDPNAPSPVGWERFLGDLWGNDTESIALAQEIAGYAISADTSLQKVMFLIGPTRAGKGVFTNVISELVGRSNVAAPTLDALTKNFGLQELIGKTLAVISDARLGTQANVAALAERLLSVSGEDRLTIDRKYRDPWTGRLGARVLIVTNELPRLSDSSEALAKRFVTLVFRHSFYGREDPNLLGTLLTELPGIFNWALDGLDRLRAQGHFTKPASTSEMIEELHDLVSPISAFLRDECVLDKNAFVVFDDLWRAWRAWCDDEGRPSGSRQMFARNLRARVPTLHVTNTRDGNRRRREYGGIGLRDNSSAEREPRVPGDDNGSGGTRGTRTTSLFDEQQFASNVEDDYPPSAFDGVDDFGSEDAQ